MVDQMGDEELPLGIEIEIGFIAGCSSTAECWNKLPSDIAKPDPAQISAEERKRRRETSLRQHAFYQLRVQLHRGKNLIAKDKGGTSDPYVKFKVNGRLLYKSKIIYRDLNPNWEESFTLPIEDPFQPVHIKVFDYDWGLQDDFMGSAYLDLTGFELGKFGKPKEPKDLQFPSPQTYPTVDADVFMTKSPAYTMGIRREPLKPDFEVPPIGYYNPNYDYFKKKCDIAIPRNEDECVEVPLDLGSFQTERLAHNMFE